MKLLQYLVLSAGVFLLLVERETEGTPCGACQCYYRTRFVTCSGVQANDIYDTMRMEDLAWAHTLDLRNVKGVLDSHFYSVLRFPDVYEVDLRGTFFTFIFHSCELS